MTGLSAASARPRAADIPTRSPVKLPGPVVTAMRSSSLNSMAAPSITRAINGISASAWPRCMVSVSLAMMACRSLSSTAAEQASRAVSIARTRMTSEIAQNAKRRELAGRLFVLRAAGLHRPHLHHIWHVVAQQVLNTVAKCCGRRRAAGAGALHVEKHHAIFEAAERYVAAIILDSGANAGLDQLLDGGDCFGVLGVEELVRSGGWRRAGFAAQKRCARHEMLHDGTEDCGLELLPFAAGLGDRDEVGAEKDTAHPRNCE